MYSVIIDQKDCSLLQFYDEKHDQFSICRIGCVCVIVLEGDKHVWDVLCRLKTHESGVEAP